MKDFLIYVMLSAVFVVLSGEEAFAQSKLQQDKKAIKNMCGCHHVTFE